MLVLVFVGELVSMSVSVLVFVTVLVPEAVLVMVGLFVLVMPEIISSSPLILHLTCSHSTVDAPVFARLLEGGLPVEQYPGQART